MTTDIKKFAEEFLATLSWDKRSVRTTFKLSPAAIEDITWCSKHYGGTVKEFFDILALKFVLYALGGEQEKHPLLRELTDEANKAEFEKTDRSIRKTYVVSTGSLRVLTGLSKKHQVPRDLLVEQAVRFSKESIEKEQEEVRHKHEKALQIVTKHWRELGEGEKELKSLLDEDDPIRERFGVAWLILMNLHGAIEVALRDGTPVHPDWSS